MSTDLLPARRVIEGRIVPTVPALRPTHVVTRWGTVVGFFAVADLTAMVAGRDWAFWVLAVMLLAAVVGLGLALAAPIGGTR